MKAREYWNECEYPSDYPVAGEDNYGFRALPGGIWASTYGTADVIGFFDIGRYGYWWTSTEDAEMGNPGTAAHNSYLSHCSSGGGFGFAGLPSSPKSDLMSVRCVGDNVQP